MSLAITLGVAAVVIAGLVILIRDNWVSPYDRPCPRCGARVGEQCRDLRNPARATVMAGLHKERK